MSVESIITLKLAISALIRHNGNMIKMPRKGKISPNGVVLKNHENATVVFLTELGYNIELIPTSNIKGVHTPDIRIRGVEWEIKTPIGEGKQLMENTIQKALRQSQNVIVDLRHTKRHQTRCIRELQKQFNSKKKIKRLLIILKDGRTIDMKK